jgi:hypothetical protein
MDIEWYRGSDNPGWGAKVSDRAAQSWEKRVKSYRSQYWLFLKHWDLKWMPPNYRGDIVFACDSQGFSDLDEMVGKFDYWAFFFYPSTVFYQIGYEADQKWWKKLNKPTRDIGTAISERIKQRCGIFWVDFTLRDVLPTK